VRTTVTRLETGLCLALGALAQLVAASAGAQERNFSIDPPRIERATAQLLEKPTPLGNALVEIVMARGEKLPLQIPIFLERSEVLLRDDGMAGDRTGKDGIYSAILSLDVQALGRNQERVRKLLDRHGKLTMPIYRGRTLVARAALPEDFLVPIRPGVRVPLEWWGFDVGIQSGKSLLIRDLSVVEDPERTYDPCSRTGTPMGKWTFGYLMTQLANPAYTGLDPADFTEQWVETFLSTQIVNGFDVIPRPQFQNLVLDHWPKTPTGQLDLVKAPFKLLAIVNRVDLRGNSVYGGGGNAGEARLVFGFAKCVAGVSTSVAPHLTVILEYGIKKSGCLQVRSWAQQWTALGDLVLGSSQYNDALQAITDQFSLAGAAPSRPNQSALNQLRTNGGMSDAFWQLREFKLTGSGAAISQLLPATVAQTPDSDVMPEFANVFSYPNPNALADYVNAHESSIVADQHTVLLSFGGLPFRGASSSRHGVVYGWNSPLITNREARHKFALQTCNGCHFDETATTMGAQQFFHILPVTNGPAALSGFMTGIDVTDPFDGAPIRHFDELERRAADLDGLVNNQCISSLDTRRLIPVSFAH